MNKSITSIAIHGGAGTIPRGSLTAEKEKMYLEALRVALEAGNVILKSGGSSLDAVCRAVMELENCPLFNAGRGSVFTHDGKIEMDASIMDGSNLDAGAIAACTGIQNPVLLARLVMEKTDHVLLVGEGANRFAEEMNIPRWPDEYFHTEFRWKQLESIRHTGNTMLDHQEKEKKFGTVGAVALDQFGNLAAATSTGGMTNKKYGRIGDSPIIGAGTYANNSSCAISCTGSGEYFIKCSAAFQVHAAMKYGGLSLEEACHQVVHKELVAMGGDGGLIAIDSSGNICMPFNTEGMYRASIDVDGKMEVLIYS
ncbi:MAG: isoaspartyl peptidase/L-asparaginase [Saprospiraceae bacterium]|nr:isoaspartyl peptidase/L-asparaginase [Saprospiraceae bacterium]